MTECLRRKAVVCVVLCFCLSTGMISIIQGEEILNKQSVEDADGTRLMSDETSVICGYATDSVTGDPVEDVDVGLSWEDFEGNSGWDTTYTDSTGFYLYLTVPVEFRLYFYPENYFDEHTPTYIVGEDQIFWLNISLVPVPAQTAHIQGYLTDNVSGEPIEAAIINLNWYEEGAHYWHNDTFSNSSGYYSIGSIPGRVVLTIYYTYYFPYESGDLFLQDNSLFWFNISLTPYPDATAFICGYITDADLGDPIPNVHVGIHCYTEYGDFDNSTYTDELGFYTVGTIPGILNIYCYCDDYESTYSQGYLIEENDTLWINFTMTYQPMEDSEIKGYVIDGMTHAAIRNAFIRYDWKDDIGHYYSQSTYTDQKGFYSIFAPGGLIQFFIRGNGYTDQNTSWFFIYEQTANWLNATLVPEITVVFDKPQPGLYINNESRFPILSKILSRLFPKSKPWIIGPLEIVINVTKSTLGCNRVEFYIDNTYVGTDAKEPFTYYWNETGFSSYTIRAIAYDNAGPFTMKSITVFKFR